MGDSAGAGESTLRWVVQRGQERARSGGWFRASGTQGLMRMDYLSSGVRFERRVVGNHSFEHLWRLQHRSTSVDVNTQWG